jgi:hypothetical protein
VAPAALWLIGGALAFMASSTMALMAGFLVLGLAIDDINGYLKGNESLTGDFIKFIKENIPYFTILGAAILGVAGYFTVMAAAAVVAWLAVAWPILLVIAAIAAVAAAVLTVEAYWGEMVAFFAGIWNSIVASASMAIEAVVNSFHQLKDWLTSIGSFIKQIWTAVWDEITASLLAKIDIMKGYWNNLKALFGAPIKAAIEAVSPAIAQARSNIVPFATGTQVQGGVGLNSFAPRQGRAQATNITVNQTLPPGTTAQTAEAAKSATIQALQPMDKLARQAGQAQ